MKEGEDTQAPAGRLALETMSQAELREVVRAANILYFRSMAWDQSTWMGHKAVKCPNDMWAYQELVHRLRPDVIVETGTYAGGSGLFFAQLCQLMGHGRVVTVDCTPLPDRPQHDRLTYLTGDVLAVQTQAEVRAQVAGAGAVMVVLDSAHGRDHVLAELRAYAELVTVGSYLIVEDTAFDAWPAWEAFGPGPAAAVEAFLAERTDFAVDHGCAKHLITLAPGGFLKRIS